MISIIRGLFALLSAAVLMVTGVRAEEWRHVCVKEEAEMTCPPREVAIQNKEYKSLSWIVTDPYDASLKQYAVYCGSDPANCRRYPLKGSFVHRISVRNPVQGKMHVKLLREHDSLSFTCSVKLKEEKGPSVYQVNVSSSVKCLIARAGQDINLSQSSEETNQTSQKSPVQETWWHIIQPNGKRLHVVYCNPTKCKYTPCYGKSCPKCLSRLKMKGRSMILENTQQDDQGLKLQCTTKTRVSGKMTRNARVYFVGIKEVLPKLSTDSSHTSPDREPGTAKTPTRNKTTRSHNTQTSTGSRFPLTVFINLALVTFLQSF